MMARPAVSARTADGAVVFLGDLPRGLMMPDLPGALCAAPGQDPDLWHPANGNRAGAERAKQICQRCPVREGCLAWALQAHEEHGVWGGTTPRDRRKIRRGKTDPQGVAA